MLQSRIKAVDNFHSNSPTTIQKHTDVSSTLMMMVVSFSDTLLHCTHTPQVYIPEGRNFHSLLYHNLKFPVTKT